MPPLGPRPRTVPVKAHTRSAPKAQKGKSNPTPRKQGQSLAQAPAAKVPKPRGHAPTVFQRPIGSDTPTQRMQTKQERKTARARLNLQKAESGYVEQNYGPRYVVKKVPSRPLAKREVDQALGRGKTPVQSVQRTISKEAGKSAQPAKPKKGKGFSLAAVGGDIPKELQGAGALEKAVTNVGAASGQGWQMALGKVGLPGVGKAIGKVPRDTAQILAGTVPSLYLPAKALAEGKPGKAAGMITGGVKETLKHPGEHPVGLLLTLRGGEGAVSRGLGEAAKKGALGGAARGVVKEDRLPLALGGAALETRKPSKGLIEATGQKALDRRAVKKGRGVTVKVPLSDAQGRRYNARVKAIQPTARQRTGTHLFGGGKVNRRAAREYGTAVTLQRNMRNEPLLAFDRSLPKHGVDAVALINRGVLKSPRTVEHDLHLELDRLRKERQSMTDIADRALNQENTARIQGLLDNKKFLAKPDKAFGAARTYADLHAPAEAKRGLYGDINEGHINRRPLLDFAAREMGLRKNEKTNRFEDPQTGRPVSNDEIAKAFEAAGGDLRNLAYVPLKHEFTGPSNFYVPPLRRAGAERKAFTGSAAITGAHEGGIEVLRNQLARAYTKVAQHETTNHLLSTFGLKQDNGTFFDHDSAVREARSQLQIYKDTQGRQGADLVPVTAARQSAPDTLVSGIDPAEQVHTLRPAAPGDSHVVLMPRDVLEHFAEQQKVRPYAGKIFPTLTRINRAFRHTVLSTSTRWLTGDTVETYLRMQLHELTPIQIGTTIRAGQKLEGLVRERFGDEAVNRLRASTGTGIYGADKQMDIHDPKAKGLGKFVDDWNREAENLAWRDPKRLLHLWTSYRLGVRAFNTVITERSPYYYVLGKHAQGEVREMTSLMDRALRKQGPAMEDVARGLTQSNNIDALSRELDRLRGRYTNLSPEGRWFTTVLTPFGNWWANANYFVFVTMPVRHPVKQALIAAASAGTEKQRAAMQQPPYGRSGVPLKGNRFLPFEHYLPYGIFEGANPNASPTAKEGTLSTYLKNVLGAGQSAVLPQLGGAQQALAGKMWTGQDLPPGTSPVWAALYTTGETMVPLLGRARTVLERGGTAKPGSTIFHPKTKPHTAKGIGAGLDKAFNPLRAQGGGPDLSGTKLAPSGASTGGNRFLQGAAGNRFLQSSGSGNRFLTP